MHCFVEGKVPTLAFIAALRKVRGPVNFDFRSAVWDGACQKTDQSVIRVVF